MATSQGLALLKPIHTRRVNSVGFDDEMEEEPLSPLARVFHAPEVNCFIVVAFGCKTKIDVQQFKKGLENSLAKHPRFSSKLVFDDKKTMEPVKWVRTTVNIDDHVIVPKLDPGMDSPDQLVEDYISNISKTSMDMSKPLWELHILNVKTSESESIGVYRIHHSLGDGVSIISLVLASTRKTSDPDAFPSLPVPKKKVKNVEDKTKVANWFTRWMFTLMMIFNVLWINVADLALFIATLSGLKDTRNPLRGATGFEQAPRRFVHRVLSFDDFKLIKNYMGVTVNDVALGIAKAGVSRYIYSRFGVEGGDKKAPEYNIFKNSRLRAILFVNLRPTAVDTKDLAEMLEKRTTVGWLWGNIIGYILCPFNIALRDDPLDYIRDSRSIMEQKKRSILAKFSNSFTKLLVHTLGLRAASNVMYKSLSNTTLSFSNVAGPTEEVSFYGHPLAFFAPSLYGFPQGLVIHFQSYMDKMTVTLSVDEDVIPDPHRLCDKIQESLLLAKKAVMDKVC